MNWQMNIDIISIMISSGDSRKGSRRRCNSKRCSNSRKRSHREERITLKETNGLRSRWWGQIQNTHRTTIATTLIAAGNDVKRAATLDDNSDGNENDAWRRIVAPITAIPTARWLSGWGAPDDDVADPIGSGGDSSDSGSSWMRTVNSEFTENYLTLILDSRYHIKIKRNKYKVNFVVLNIYRIVYL